MQLMMLLKLIAVTLLLFFLIPVVVFAFLICLGLWEELLWRKGG